MFAYRVKVKGEWREFEFRPIAEVPQDVLTTGTSESQLWALLSWGLIDYGRMKIIDEMPMRRILDMVECWEDDSHISVEEIRGVIETADEHRGPLEMDLINKGLRLRDCPSPQFNWRDLWVIIHYADVHTNLMASADPDRFGWGRTELLLADIADDNDWLVWAKTAAARERGATPPLRRERPGVKNPKPRAGSKVKAAPISKIREVYKLDERHAQQDQLSRQRKLEAVFR